MGDKDAPVPVLDELEGTVQRLDKEIENTQAALREYDAKYRAGRDQLRAHIRALKASRRELTRSRPAKAVSASKRPLNPETQAGKKNVQKLRTTAKRLGTASQRELSKRSKVPTGNLTWAIKALAARGELEPTGEKDEHGSRIFRYVGETGSTLKPGE